TDVDLSARNVVLPSFKCGRFGKTRYSVLRGRVADHRRPWRRGRKGSVIDDAAAARLLALHQSKSRPSAQEGAGEIGVNGRSPVVNLQIFECGRSRRNTGVVKEEIEPAKPAFYLGEKGLDRRRLGDIRDQGERRGTSLNCNLIELRFPSAGQ